MLSQTFSNEDAIHMFQTVRTAFQFKDTVVPAAQSAVNTDSRDSAADASADDDVAAESDAGGADVSVTVADLVEQFPDLPVHQFAHRKGYFVFDEAKLFTEPRGTHDAQPDTIEGPGAYGDVDVERENSGLAEPGSSGDFEDLGTGVDDPALGLRELNGTVAYDQRRHDVNGEGTLLSGATPQAGGGVFFSVAANVSVGGRSVFLSSVVHNQQPAPAEGAQLRSRTRPLILSGRGAAVDLLLSRQGNDASGVGDGNAYHDGSPEPAGQPQRAYIAAGERLRWEVPVSQGRPYNFSALERLSHAKIFFVEDDTGLSDSTDAGNRFKLKCSCRIYSRARARVFREARICAHIVQVVAFRETATGNVVDEEFFYPSVVDADFLQQEVRSRTEVRPPREGRATVDIYERVMRLLSARVDAWAASKFNPNSSGYCPGSPLPLEDANFCDKAIREAGRLKGGLLSWTRSLAYFNILGSGT